MNEITSKICAVLVSCVLLSNSLILTPSYGISQSIPFNQGSNVITVNAENGTIPEIIVEGKTITNIVPNSTFDNSIKPFESFNSYCTLTHESGGSLKVMKSSNRPYFGLNSNIAFESGRKILVSTRARGSKNGTILVELQNGWGDGRQHDVRPNFSLSTDYQTFSQVIDLTGNVVSIVIDGSDYTSFGDWVELDWLTIIDVTGLTDEQIKSIGLLKGTQDMSDLMIERRGESTQNYASSQIDQVFLNEYLGENDKLVISSGVAQIQRYQKTVKLDNSLNFKHYWGGVPGVETVRAKLVDNPVNLSGIVTKFNGKDLVLHPPGTHLSYPDK